MEIFKEMEKADYEQLIFCQDESVGLKAIICIHNTILGPAAGGARIYPYSTEEEAIIDVLRLAKGMTYKASVAGLDFGGGKAVIIGDPKDKSEALLRTFGKFIDTLGGKYIMAIDVGMTTEDVEIIHRETKHMVCLPKNLGGSGDPSPVTAFGVNWGLKACLEEVFGSISVKGKTIAIQGIAGKVGKSLAQLLAKEGAILFGSDANQKAALEIGQELSATIVNPGVMPDKTYDFNQDEIYDVECDIFSPNAMGGILRDETIPRLRCKIIAGGANNQLLQPRHGDMLYRLGILYAPDYVINAGGIINAYHERDPGGYAEARALADARKIYDRIKKVIEISKRDNIPTHLAADRMAEERIHQATLRKKLVV